MKKKQRKTVVIGARIHNDLLLAIDAAAEREGVTRSLYIQQLMERYTPKGGLNLNVN